MFFYIDENEWKTKLAIAIKRSIIENTLMKKHDPYALR
jgi:hypothetical protein